ncbi:tumor protein p53-inducible nuclear protein 2 isoform X1 [Ischnura elegans]|uniref:tumor protein p53-inducible nuclear protein 2 isoform X1 n=1 Tax=Ischnura elegans TaxID=197161 RepID=UPI001ED8B310|nr:tumor protein p53-inducible nuclear protein 2 isoform X1 [Ischnura elegans]XP_046391464.1 tumor protein p53-inducible nuclear protein 2 isoform X1 [Ischnura elegans]XP_046391465.1 tumor protein p53-inducible nuclear protein 2 isoform X1 [Ischnura elegans]
MFSNIANYLRGVNSNNDVQDVLSVNAEVGPALCEGPSNCEYNAVDTDDDWVLVNKSEASATQGSVECIVLCAQSMPQQQSAAEGRLLRRSPSSSSLPSSLDESWFLTPPPCFTSTGPVHMETSSLENLLIEHPSMSVYQQRLPPPTSSSPPPPIEIVACESVAEFDEEPAADLVLSGSLVLMVAPSSSSSGAQAEGSGTLVRRGGAAVNASSHIESQEHRLLKLRSAQKVQQKRACQVLKRGPLDRSNKARELNSRNKIQRRSDRMLRHSGANNNRKC